MKVSHDMPETRGRKSKRTQATAKTILRLLEEGNVRKTAYTIAGIDDNTFYRWLNDDGEFRAAVEKAEETCVARCVSLVQAAAISTWQAAAWYLERRRPQEWGRLVSVAPTAVERPSEEVANALADRIASLTVPG